MTKGVFVDMAGKRYGRWTVIDEALPRSGALRWNARCDCGRVTTVIGASLRNGRLQSCGCLSVDFNRAHTKHGLCDSPEYRCWDAIKQRCENPNRRLYRHYGGRGITMCERWQNDFVAFYADMGPRPSPKHSIDRIDVNKGYSPDNCRWADRETQDNNRTDTRYVDYAGRRLSVTQAVRLAGSVVDHRTAIGRVRRGWAVARAVETPAQAKS